jgi:hypothetical protein
MITLCAPLFSTGYWLGLGLLLAARGLDFFSTWVATPSLALEANAVMRRLGWRVAAALNLAVCVVAAAVPFVAVLVSVTSVMVAARNFQGAWVMRAMGEFEYREHLRGQFRRADWRLVLGCVWAQTALYTAVGVALAATTRELFTAAVGWGIVGFGLAIGVHSTHAYRKARHALSDEERVSQTGGSR